MLKMYKVPVGLTDKEAEEIKTIFSLPASRVCSRDALAASKTQQIDS
jgi:hypothetical protein